MVPILLSVRGQSLFMHPALCLQDKAEIKVKLEHLDYVEYFIEFGTRFSKLKIMRTAITYSTKKCDVLVDPCLTHNNAYGDWKIS